jgi:hypothetical protein
MRGLRKRSWANDDSKLSQLYTSAGDLKTETSFLPPVALFTVGNPWADIQIDVKISGEGLC